MQQESQTGTVLRQLDLAVLWVEKAVVLILFLAIAALVAAGIVSRLGHIVLPWTNEAAQLLLVWLIFFGANMGNYFREHVGVTILPDSTTGGTRTAIVLFIKLSIFAFSAYVAWAGTQFVFIQHMMGGTTFSLPIDVPKYMIAMVLPVSFIMGSVHVLVDLIDTPTDDPYSRPSLEVGDQGDVEQVPFNCKKVGEI